MIAAVIAAAIPLVNSILTAAKPVLENIIPDPIKRAQIEAALVQASRQIDIEELKVQLSPILAEAQSVDPWTSRARPTFLYVMYGFLCFSFPMGVLYAFSPVEAMHVADGVKAWLGAMPESVWWLFGAGYLGYTGARSFDKAKRTAK